jgi:hypothetical protein
MKTPMVLPNRYIAILGVLLACSLISCSNSQASGDAPDHSAILKAVAAYGAGHAPNLAAPIRAFISDLPMEKHLPPNADVELRYKLQIINFLVLGNYDALEKEATESRQTKAVLPGGIWKLLDLYEAFTEPCPGYQLDEQELSKSIVLLQKWVDDRPKSATARIALANAYIAYAWAARGSGYVDSVDQRGWNFMHQRLELATKTLLEAATLPEKCPEWYTVVQDIALGEGWSNSDTRNVFDAASAFEPDYLMFYRKEAYHLLPKWHGQPGDSEAFAEEMSRTNPGPRGDFVYFEIATQLSLETETMPAMSWDKIKAGYQFMQNRFGTSPLKANRFAYLATLKQDRSAAQEAFAAIKGNREATIWDVAEFEAAKAWAQAN